ncbi:MAG: ABC transporter permease [Thermoplasmatales archaeon]|nr:ABC transporter permease [Thermoplasmatales archaeon]
MRKLDLYQDRHIAKHLDETEPDEEGYFDMGSGRVRDVAISFATFAAGVAIVILMWQALALYGNAFLGLSMAFPTPADSFGRLWEWLSQDANLFGHSLTEHVLASLKRWFVAFALAALTGVALGSLLGYFDKFYSVGIVPVTVLQTIPGLAWIPIAILLFGIGDESAIFIIYMVSSMVITINVAGGIRMVPDTVLRAGGMMGAGNLVVFLKILIPYATVDIINGLRVGMGSAWRVLIAAEMLVGSGIGLGASIELLRCILDYVGAFACIVIICAIGLLMDKVVFTGIEKYARHKLGMEEGY